VKESELVNEYDSAVAKFWDGVNAKINGECSKIGLVSIEIEILA
jgi:hypothetical protein